MISPLLHSGCRGFRFGHGDDHSAILRRQEFICHPLDIFLGDGGNFVEARVD